MSPEEHYERYKRLAVISWAIVGIMTVLAVAVCLLDYLLPVLYPFIYAAIIVYLLRPVVEKFVSIGLPRLLAVLVTYLLVIATLTLVIIYFLPTIVRQMTAFVDDLPVYSRTLVDYIASVRVSYSRIHLSAETTKFIDQMAGNVRGAGLAQFKRLPETTAGVFGGLLNVILAPVLAFYVLKDLPAIRTTVLELFPERHRNNVSVVFRQVDYVLGGFLRGQALVSLVVAITTGFALWLAGVQFPFLLGTLTGLLNIIPYFGPILGGAIAATVALFQSPIKALVVIVIMFAVQQVDGMIISPNIMRHAVDLHPTIIVFSLLLGGALLGFMGLLLAIPVAAMAKGLVMYFFYSEDQLPPGLTHKEATP